MKVRPQESKKLKVVCARWNHMASERRKYQKFERDVHDELLHKYTDLNIIPCLEVSFEQDYKIG